jgi:hypothetical protein
MSEWQEIFNQGESQGEPGLDFEEKVFSKIKRKKRQRKVGFTAMALAGAVLLLSLFQLFRPAAGPVLVSRTETGKEEIPLSENLFFSASDNRVRYSIEPVSYPKKSADQKETLNQI